LHLEGDLKGWTTIAARQTAAGVPIVTHRDTCPQSWFLPGLRAWCGTGHLDRFGMLLLFLLFPTFGVDSGAHLHQGARQKPPRVTGSHYLAPFSTVHPFIRSRRNLKTLIIPLFPTVAKPQNLLKYRHNLQKWP
jgi:hypothetical protein